jgi:hypothetical protein
MAEDGIPEAAMQSIARHLLKKMLHHLCVRMPAKRTAVEVLGCLIACSAKEWAELGRGPSR